MVDAAGVPPDALACAQRRLVDAMLPDAAHARGPSVALAPFARVAAASAGSVALAARQASLTSHAAAALPSLLCAPPTWAEVASIASAVTRQYQALQAQWIDGWTDLAVEVASVRRPDTLTRYVDQESNLAHQALALVTAQVTATARTQEGILVGLAWWLARRADEERTERGSAEASSGQGDPTAGTRRAG